MSQGSIHTALHDNVRVTSTKKTPQLERRLCRHCLPWVAHTVLHVLPLLLGPKECINVKTHSFQFQIPPHLLSSLLGRVVALNAFPLLFTRYLNFPPVAPSGNPLSSPHEMVIYTCGASISLILDNLKNLYCGVSGVGFPS